MNVMNEFLMNVIALKTFHAITKPAVHFCDVLALILICNRSKSALCMKKTEIISSFFHAYCYLILSLIYLIVLMN